MFGQLRENKYFLFIKLDERCDLCFVWNNVNFWNVFYFRFPYQEYIFKINKKTIFIFLEISFYTMLFFILAGFGFIGFMIYILFGEEQKFINKYCIDGKQENGCESGTIFFLFVKNINFIKNS